MDPSIAEREAWRDLKILLVKRWPDFERQILRIDDNAGFLFEFYRLRNGWLSYFRGRTRAVPDDGLSHDAQEALAQLLLLAPQDPLEIVLGFQLARKLDLRDMTGHLLVAGLARARVTRHTAVHVSFPLVLGSVAAVVVLWVASGMFLGDPLVMPTALIIVALPLLAFQWFSLVWHRWTLMTSIAKVSLVDSRPPRHASTNSLFATEFIAGVTSLVCYGSVVGILGFSCDAVRARPGLSWMRPLFEFSPVVSVLPALVLFLFQLHHVTRRPDVILETMRDPMTAWRERLSRRLELRR